MSAYAFESDFKFVFSNLFLATNDDFFENLKEIDFIFYLR